MDTKLSLSLMCIIYKIKFKKLHTYINLTEFEKQNYQQKKTIVSAVEIGQKKATKYLERNAKSLEHVCVKTQKPFKYVAIKV